MFHTSALALGDEQIEQLRPILSILTDCIRENSKVPDEKTLQYLLSIEELTSGWAEEEILRWARILVGVRNNQTEEIRAIAINALVRRGIPFAEAVSAVDAVIDGLPVSLPSSPLRVTPSSLRLGIYDSGTSAAGVLRVEGGPGNVYGGCDRIHVEPEKFGAEPTDITVSVSEIYGDTLLDSAVTFEKEGHLLQVEVIGQWKSASLHSESLRLKELESAKRPYEVWGGEPPPEQAVVAGISQHHTGGDADKSGSGYAVVQASPEPVKPPEPARTERRNPLITNKEFKETHRK